VSLDHALAAAKRGWSVFPIKAREKEPVGRWTEEATTDPKTITAWLAGTSLNYGIACGPSGLVVIDEDAPGAADRLAQACGYDTLPATFTVSTAKGRHFYYRINGTPVRTGVRKVPGIDVRAVGGYVVGPGSTHVTGARYEVADGRDTLLLPVWLARVLNDGLRASEASPLPAGEVPVTVPQPRVADEPIPDRIGAGSRHDTIMRRAASMRARGATLTEALIVSRYLHQRCDQPTGDPYPWDTAAATVRDVFTRYDGPETYGELLTPEEVEREARRLRVQQAAREKVAAETAANLPLPELVRLDKFLATPDEEVAHRVARLWPTGGRVVLAAQNKAGKTTLVGNLLRALADGEPFLGRFPVARARRVVLVDDELDERMLRGWLREQRIATETAVELVPLRGRLSAFNILDPATRSRWARSIGTADILLLDCLRPALDALALSEDKDAGRFLEALDELLTEAGVGEALVVHHMGHTGERSRGDSRILDWPDAKWRLVRERGEEGEELDETAARYFTAYGRDVDQPETLLAYDPDTRRLTAAGGSRAEVRRQGVMDAIRGFLAENPRSSKNAIETGVEYRRDSVRDALRELVRSGEVACEKTGQSFLHTLTSPTRPTSPRRMGEVGAEDLAPSPIGRGRGPARPAGDEEAEPRPGEVERLLADQLGATPLDDEEEP